MDRPGIVSIERIAGNGTGRPREETMSPVNSSSAIPGNALITTALDRWEDCV